MPGDGWLQPITIPGRPSTTGCIPANGIPMLTPAPSLPDARRLLLIGGCGYIGSFLHSRLLSGGFEVTVCDLLARGNPLGIEVIRSDYAVLPADFLQQFGAVLWFGGHSSVKQAIEDPDGAVSNNCLNLFVFAKKLHPSTKLIYASTGSLYSTKERDFAPASESSTAHIPTQNAYDMSKFAFDYLAQNFLENFHALRMGTLAGYSPNLREELVFNAMNLSAMRTGRVHLKNSGARRTILFLSDLWVLIEKLLTTECKPGICNAGSLSFTLGELAHAVAATWQAEVSDEGESETYSFLLDTTQMKTLCGHPLASIGIGEHCRQFIDEYRTARGIS
ncbi:NAD-dependent epimerase/dehydratase family protein [Variovorax boronicumulans]|uniref:NAD-dependent epimerase/dehydratase family protein n=1 Tax=Variovorax boronicumulans TaxID=436515 RepID=UPI0027800DE4|nr:NAD-dependent epimerase/dehydratase family protein [Variovorax boronicumulans]MDQ0041821.1 nucleoside-diphosphate-sugar epimerase [Variovorax boronicumulans]